MSAELLERATRALRASTERDGAGGRDARLQRALERLQRAERAPARSPRRLRTTAWTLAATLAGAGAWAHATGKVHWFASAPETAASAAPAARTVRHAPAAEVAAPETGAEPTLPRTELVAPEIAAPEVVPPEVAAPKVESRQRARRAAPVLPPVSADALYREAHAAHFTQRDYGAALVAWDRYLAAAGPAHRMTVEARFNRGVALFRLGQKEAARHALRPFAEGEYGSYRREEAASLLEALRSTP